MAQFNFTSNAAAGGNPRQPASNEWTVSDGEAATGDIINLDILANQETPDGYQLEYYEVELAESGGATRTVNADWGPWVNKQRRIRVDTASTAQTVRIRAVFELRNQFQSRGASGYTEGAAIVHTDTGSTGTFLEKRGDFIVMTDISGSFALDYASTVDPTAQDITIDGVAEEQEGKLHPTHHSDLAVQLKSDWSDTKPVTPSVGTPTVTINANKTTCLQGEAVILTVDVNGFDSLLDTHDLHYEWNVPTVAEQGTHAALVGTVWEDEFGASQNKRHQGFSRVWAFAPKTIGSVDIDITVRDRSGNVVDTSVDGGTLTLTSVAPLDEAGGGFADADIYALSDTSRAVPGAAGANIYTDYGTLIAALPSTGEALILFDTNGATASGGSTTDYNLIVNPPDRVAFMPYNDTGVGVAAGAKASINFALRAEAATFIVYGIDSNGPFDPTDPYSLPSGGLPLQGVRHEPTVAGATSIFDCDVRGWEYNYAPCPGPDGTYAAVDCHFEGCRNFEIFQPDPGLHAIAGVIAHHNPESWWSSTDATKVETTPPFLVDHTPYRASRRDGDAGISKSSFLAVAGWSGNSQPAIRMFGTGNQYPRVAHTTEVRLEERAGGILMASTSASWNNFEGPQDMVWDKLAVYVSELPTSLMTIGVAPFTIRNAKFVFSDVEPLRKSTNGARGGQYFFALDSGASNVVGQWNVDDYPIVLENVTAVSLVSNTYFNTANFSAEENFFMLTSKNYENVWSFTERNNLYKLLGDQTVDPNTSQKYSPAQATGTLNTTSRYTPLFQAKRDWNDDQPSPGSTGAEKLTWNLANSVDTSVNNPASMTATFEPQSDSNAYQGATGSIPYDDILSRVRPTDGTASKGAYDPGGT